MNKHHSSEHRTWNLALGPVFIRNKIPTKGATGPNSTRVFPAGGPTQGPARPRVSEGLTPDLVGAGCYPSPWVFRYWVLPLGELLELSIRHLLANL